MNKRTTLTLLAVMGLVVVGVAAVYFIFSAQAGYIEGRPTMMYFHAGN